MKVISAHAMQEIDRRAIKEFGIPGHELMENAGRRCTEEIVAAYGGDGGKRAVVFAGKGNNGGDGYVIARHLLERGWQVQVIVLARREEIKGDALISLVLLPDDILCFCPEEGELTSRYHGDIQAADLLVDALLGTGLNHELRGVYREAVALINRAPGRVAAVDIPSGIHGTTGSVMGQAVRADLTVTFACAKLGHVLYPGAEHVGRLVVADIGIPQQVSETAVGYEFLDECQAAALAMRRARTAHKGNCGHCLVVAGSPGKTGAAVLAANSAVRAGAGLVTLALPEQLHQIAEVKTTEVMTVALPALENGFLAAQARPVIEGLLAARDVLALGPGIDRHPETVALVHGLLESATLPMVIDADGLNAIAEDRSVLQRRAPQTVVLTPHPGEMARLHGAPIPDVAAVRIAVAQEFARTHGVYLVLKGARTIMVAPNGLTAINGSGNPGMASGGMGDVLTGIIAALLAQGYPPWNACRLGVYLHGLAGDLVAGEQGEIGMTASDLMERLPRAFNRLLNRQQTRSLNSGQRSII
ncbi:NAD(P)H-hydrate dehydratase [Trichlorobacter ammonificans]|uniref:Bifunctional NAD(P)H-hydrate repair enzyme n=1 Tax=Trichlorobacter ammonificans TaxID=2916410 RepID=A0ABM9D895_9BACT|nr:NAD(P)H-hydrate dehydratase [Trichlorobacter ammonificans]CAH2031444.1 ADP-dependent (S)-NAD(P)H-hydrate dehydratase / NAD(P)H-hydrate epimerase [Trichlorobacter ammonificans]